MKEIKNYYQAVESLKEAFIKKYFKGVEVDSYWIADKIGEGIDINGYFFDMNVMVDALAANVSVKKLFKWYDYQLSQAFKKNLPMNLLSWVKLKNKKKT